MLNWVLIILLIFRLIGHDEETEKTPVSVIKLIIYKRVKLATSNKFICTDKTITELKFKLSIRSQKTFRRMRLKDERFVHIAAVNKLSGVFMTWPHVITALYPNGDNRLI